MIDVRVEAREAKHGIVLFAHLDHDVDRASGYMKGRYGSRRPLPMRPENGVVQWQTLYNKWYDIPESASAKVEQAFQMNSETVSFE